MYLICIFFYIQSVEYFLEKQIKLLLAADKNILLKCKVSYYNILTSAIRLAHNQAQNDKTYSFLTLVLRQ